MTLSVLIVSWGQTARLAACVGAVRRFLPGARTVVVDNGSAPPLTPLPGCDWVRAPRNLGYAGGCALGWARCAGEAVLLLNNDALLPSAEPVETLLAFLAAHPRVAAAQATLLLPDGTLDACGESLTPLGLLFHHGYRRPPGPHAARAYPVLAAKAACALVRRAAVEDAGGLFRPDAFCYYEDIDLGHRLWLAGWECWYVPTRPVLHDEATTARTLPARDVWRRYLGNMLTSARDLWGWRLWLTLGAPFLCALALAALRHRVWPRTLPRAGRLVCPRRRAERDLLRHVLAHPPPAYYLALVTRRF